MSSSAPPLSTTIPAILSIPISEKLTKSNYPLWRVQVLPVVHAAQLEGLLTGAEKAPRVNYPDKSFTPGAAGSWLQTKTPEYNWFPTTAYKYTPYQKMTLPLTGWRGGPTKHKRN
jgi:hypothetical protein